MAKPRSVREQLADERAHSARLERALRHRAPGTTRDGRKAWEVLNEAAAWLTELDELDWPLSGQGPATAIKQAGHSDPTGNAAARREKGWQPAAEATRVLDRILRVIADSRGDTLGAARITPRMTLRTADCCSNDHAHTWTVCPWTGQPLAATAHTEDPTEPRPTRTPEPQRRPQPRAETPKRREPLPCHVCGEPLMKHSITAPCAR